MCGIIGVLGSLPKKNVQGIGKTLTHRGPDAHGAWSDSVVSLAHRRLSIIDLSAEANQPFEKNGLVIVYNGEIYNYKELSHALKQKGVQLKTTSDTEVIVELFRLYGEESFSQLTGMFAFSLYDIRKKTIYLVRDYYGIKPLYYAQPTQNSFVFSSELKALLKCMPKPYTVNRRSLVASLNYLWIDTNESIVEGVYQLPPAHFIKIITADTVIANAPKRYWKNGFVDGMLELNDACAKLDAVLQKSVQRHLVSDVPVGAFLSGGLDSSLICALAKKYNPDLSTYTISIADKDKKIEQMPDDNAYAQRVAQHLGLRHVDIPVAPNIEEILRKVVYHLDEPIGDPAAINTYLISQLAREHGIKVLLSGMGADEIFGGYRRHQAVLLANKLRLLPYRLLRRIVNYLPVQWGNYGLKHIRWLKRFLSFAHLPLVEAYMRSYSYYDKNKLKSMFNGAADEQIEDMYDYHAHLFNARYQTDPINQMCYTDIHLFMRGLNLTYTDRASMAASVEVRVPFIDREVVSLAMSIPGTYKIKNGQQKSVLKKVAEQYLPRDIVYRPKASFGMPIRSWISRELRTMVDDLLSASQIKKRGLLNPVMIKRMIDDDRKGRHDYAYQIYQLLTLELWMQAYIDK